MIFRETKLAGAYILDVEPIADVRGFFARSYCQDEFEERGLGFAIAQCNISCNEKKGTLRGMHFQVAPHEEIKLVNCVRGSIFDVIVDLRPASPSRGDWHGEILSEKNYRSVYVPKGFAHGFQSLEEATVVFYQISEFYHPECAAGVRWDDPALGIRWPLENPILSARDQRFESISWRQG